MQLKKLIFSLCLILLIGGLTRNVYAVSATPSVIKISLKPGQTQNGSIDIHNPQEKDVFVKVAFKDWVIDKDGKWQFSEAGKSPRSLIDWLIIDHEGFALGAKKTQKVRYTIKVPEDAKGGYWGLIRFKSQPLGQATGVMVAMEVVCFISVEVEQTLTKNVTINGISATVDNEGLKLKALVKNLGNTPIFQPSPKGEFIIKDETGKKIAEGELAGGMVLPNEIAEYVNKTPVKIDKGDYTAIVTFDIGKPKLIGKKVPFTTKINYDWRSLWESSTTTPKKDEEYK